MCGFGIDLLAFEVNLCQVFKLRGVDFEIAQDQIPHFGVRAFTVAIHFCISWFSIALGLPLRCCGEDADNGDKPGGSRDNSCLFWYSDYGHAAA